MSIFDEIQVHQVTRDFVWTYYTEGPQAAQSFLVGHKAILLSDSAIEFLENQINLSPYIPDFIDTKIQMIRMRFADADGRVPPVEVILSPLIDLLKYAQTQGVERAWQGEMEARARVAAMEDLNDDDIIAAYRSLIDAESVSEVRLALADHGDILLTPPGLDWGRRLEEIGKQHNDLDMAADFRKAVAFLEAVHKVGIESAISMWSIAHQGNR